MIGAWFQAQAWKIGTAVAGAAALGLGVQLWRANIELNILRKDRDMFIAEAARLESDLSTCRGNNFRMEIALNAQNIAVKNLQTTSETRLAESAAALAKAQVAEKAAEQTIAKLRNIRPAGATTCDRAVEVDSVFLETLR